MGGNFILDGVRPDELSDKLPPRARCADAADPDSLPELLPQIAQPLGDHLHRPSLRGNVDLLQEIPVHVEKGKIRAHGPHVDPEENLRPAFEGRRLGHAVPQEYDVPCLERRPGGKRHLALIGGVCGGSKRCPLPFQRRVIRGKHRRTGRGEVSVSPRNHRVVGGETERVSDGSHHSLVGEQPPHERHPGNGILALVDAALEVAGDRLAQSFQDLLGRTPFLLGVDHVGLGEHRAPPRDPGCASRPSDHIPDLLHGQPHPVGLLVDERARPGGTVPVGVIVHDAQRASLAPRFETDDLRVFPSHFEDRPDIVVNRGHSPHQATEIVLVPGSQGLCQARSAFPGKRNPPDVVGSDPANPLSQPLRDFFVRVPKEAVVGEKIDLCAPRKRRRIGGEKGPACLPGQKGIRRTGDKNALHTDRPDVNTDDQGSSPCLKENKGSFVHCEETSPGIFKSYAPPVCA